jgi:spermidine/putrescine transport system substrate-binding protein
MSKNSKNEVRILTSRESLDAMVSRRKFMGGVAGSAALVGIGGLLAACSSGSSTESSGGGGSSTSGSTLQVFGFAEYIAPDNIEAFASSNGVTVNLTVFDSNEEALAKIDSTNGPTGYDLIVLTGVYIPTFVAKGYLSELDTTRLKNFSKLDPQYLGLPWDPDNKHSVPKSWGTTGVVYDTSVITEPIETWNDFLRIIQTDGVSGKVSMLDSPRDLIGPVCWANSIDWTTTDPDDLARVRDIMVNEVAPHLKAFDSFPGVAVAAGDYAIAHTWSGDARFGMLESDALAWSLPGPMSDLWIDSWCLSSEATNVDAAYEWMDFLFTVEAATREVDYTGYDSGLFGLREQLPDSVLFKDVIYFDPSQADMLEPGEVNSAQGEIQSIYDAVKAAAAQ